MFVVYVVFRVLVKILIFVWLLAFLINFLFVCVCSLASLLLVYMSFYHLFQPIFSCSNRDKSHDICCSADPCFSFKLQFSWNHIMRRIFTEI